MKDSDKKALIEYLHQFVSPERWQRINEVINKRTRYITVVLEDIYQPHNASAVLRSCDGFGIQDVHIVENENTFSPNSGITIGADKWISLNNYGETEKNNTEECYRQLRSEGYKIIATSPHHEDTTIGNVSLDKKIALVFGSEYTGLSDYALQHADGYARIPMQGFSESFNISVGAAICLYDLTSRLRTSNKPWTLAPEEKIDLQFEWLKKSVRAPDKLIERYYTIKTN